MNIFYQCIARFVYQRKSYISILLSYTNFSISNYIFKPPSQHGQIYPLEDIGKTRMTPIVLLVIFALLVLHRQHKCRGEQW